jgi:hypothetical protein
MTIHAAAEEMEMGMSWATPISVRVERRGTARACKLSDLVK